MFIQKSEIDFSAKGIRLNGRSVSPIFVTLIGSNPRRSSHKTAGDHLPHTRCSDFDKPCLYHPLIHPKSDCLNCLGHLWINNHLIMLNVDVLLGAGWYRLDEHIKIDHLFPNVGVRLTPPVFPLFLWPWILPCIHVTWFKENIVLLSLWVSPKLQNVFLHSKATRNTGKTIAGKNVANPSAMLLAGCLLLRHLGLNKHADLINAAVIKTVIQNKVRV